jgi:hypothetical protein
MLSSLYSDETYPRGCLIPLEWIDFLQHGPAVLEPEIF